MPTASAAVEVGSISGTVTDGVNPLEGIVVKVWDNNGFGDVVVEEATTSASGAYEVGGVEVSPYYRVQFVDPSGEYAFEYFDDTVSSQVGNPDWAKWVPVTANAATEDVDAALEPGSTISGRLTVGAGRPVEFGTISLFWQYGPNAYVRSGTFHTDEDGYYEIPGVRGETYGLEFLDSETGAKEAWNDRPGIIGSTPLIVTSGEDRTGIDALLGGVVKNTTAPTVEGTPQVGKPLTATSGWSPADTAVSYRWIVGDDATPADDPTGATYVPTAADLGKTIRVHATGTRNAGWIPATAMSAATAPVAAAPVVVPPPLPSLVNAKAPQVKGKLRVGKIVRVTKGGWTPYPKDVDYTWYAGGKVIKGAHRQWFKLTRKQVGKRLRVEVTVSAPSYADTTLRTRRTDKVKA